MPPRRWADRPRTAAQGRCHHPAEVGECADELAHALVTGRERDEIRGRRGDEQAAQERRRVAAGVDRQVRNARAAGERAPNHGPHPEDEADEVQAQWQKQGCGGVGGSDVVDVRGIADHEQSDAAEYERGCGEQPEDRRQVEHAHPVTRRGAHPHGHQGHDADRGQERRGRELHAADDHGSGVDRQPGLPYCRGQVGHAPAAGEQHRETERDDGEGEHDQGRARVRRVGAQPLPPRCGCGGGGSLPLRPRRTPPNGAAALRLGRASLGS